MKLLKYFAGQLALVGLGMCIFTGNALASFTLNFDQEFSGATPPSSSTTPWIRASFVDVSVSTVDLIITTDNLSGSENVSEFFFNFDDWLTVGNLTITQVGSSGAFTAPGISREMNGFKADGDGRYDVLLTFATGGSAAAVFGVGDSVTYRLTYAGITAGSFASESDPAGGHGPFYAAAHVQNTGGGVYSGWISPTGISDYTPVPEPASLIAGALLLLPLGASAIRSIRNRK